MKSFASAKTYSLIVGCHGMGWLPVAQSKARAATKPRYHWEYSHTPLTRFFGGLTAEYQTEVTTLAKSLSNCGLKMEYILFDDCYMSSLEAAYDLRHVTRHLIACPTEIMVYGMPYSHIGEYLLAENPDYSAICQTFYQFYSSYTYPYGTIAVTDCSRLDELALLMKDIHSRYSLDDSQTASIQRMDGYSPVIHPYITCIGWYGNSTIAVRCDYFPFHIPAIFTFPNDLLSLSPNIVRSLSNFCTVIFA